MIELLIVVAILSILTGAFFTVVIFATRQEVEVRLGATLRQEGLSVVRAVIRDAYLAHAIGDSPRAADADRGILIFNYGPMLKAGQRQVAYRRIGPRVERLIWRDDASTPTIQTLAAHVRDWQIERAGDLIHVKIILAINRYTKDFIESYSFTVRAGKVVGGSERADVPSERSPQSTSRFELPIFDRGDG